MRSRLQRMIIDKKESRRDEDGSILNSLELTMSTYSKNEERREPGQEKRQTCFRGKKWFFPFFTGLALLDKIFSGCNEVLVQGRRDLLRRFEISWSKRPKGLLKEEEEKIKGRLRYDQIRQMSFRNECLKRKSEWHGGFFNPRIN